MRNPRSKGRKPRKRNKSRSGRPTEQQSKKEQWAVVERVSELLGDMSGRAEISPSGNGSSEATESDNSSTRSVRMAGTFLASQSAEEMADTDATE